MKSPIGLVAGLLRRLRGEAPAPVEILPPEQRRSEPDWNLNMSVEERADVFASLFLDASPKDMRASRFGNLKEQ
jgi:hypothetical protein